MAQQKHWGKYAAGILPYCKSTQRYCIFLRSDKIGFHPKTWSTVGGKVDTNETNKFKTAALREMCEETKYCENIKLKLLYIFRDDNFVYRTYLGYVNEEFKTILNWENDKATWVTLNEMISHENLHPGFLEMLNNRDAMKTLESLI